MTRMRASGRVQAWAKRLATCRTRAGRNARNLAWAAVAAVAAACSIDAGRQPRALAPGDSMPLSDLSGGRPALVWVFDAEACLGCDLTGPAQGVRLLQRRMGERVETIVVAISELGEDDHALVAGFLEAQRVQADVRVRTPGAHMREFGGGPVPILYVVDGNGAVRALVDPNRMDAWRSPEDSLGLADYVDRLAKVPTMPVEARWQ